MKVILQGQMHSKLSIMDGTIYIVNALLFKTMRLWVTPLILVGHSMLLHLNSPDPFLLRHDALLPKHQLEEVKLLHELSL